jgi:Tectonin domain
MKRKIANTLFNLNSPTRALWRGRIGLPSLIALFLCSFAVSASAQWTLLPTSPSGVNLAGIQVGSQAWGRDISGNVYQDIAGTFTLIDPSGTPQFEHITVGQGTTPMWGLDFSGKSYNYNGSTFVNVPLPTGETFTSIGAGGDGVWAVNSATGHVFEYNSKTNSWMAPRTGQPTESLQSIIAGNFTIGPWALDGSGNAYLYNTRTGFFDGPIGGMPSGTTVAAVAVGNGQTWAISSASTDNVYVYDDNPAVEQFCQPNPFALATLSEISLSTDENLWGVNSAGQTYLFNTSSIEFVLTAQPPQATFEVKVGAAGTFALSKGTGQVYQFK